MSALPPDYDTDPERTRVTDRAWLVHGDTHELVAERLIAEGIDSILDLGCGRGRLGELLVPVSEWVGLDSSPTQLRDCPHRPVVQADAAHLPFPPETFGAVAALWMLYHFESPAAVITEARRVLRPGGVFIACTSARDNDPELTDGYPPTTFDAEEAPEIVAAVFGKATTEVERWDASLVRLPDRDAVLRYARSHHLPPETAERVTTPVSLTKRGCLIWSRSTG